MDLDEKFKIISGGRTNRTKLSRALILYEKILKLENNTEYKLMKNDFGIVIYKEAK